MDIQNLQEMSIMFSFLILPDPRKSRNQCYSLFDIVTVAIRGILCGADDWVEISLWAQGNQEWLQEYGICSRGVPSHDTLSRFFRFVDPVAFEKCFISWTQRIAKTVGGIIALDGKTICNSADGDEKEIHLVTAFSVENGLILGQLATEAKSNEITAFPLLLQLLDLKEAIMTIDAAGCQKGIASQIRNQGGDYVLALKGNQGNLHAEAENFFKQALEVDPKEADCDYYLNEEKSRDRIEKREVWSISNLDWLLQKEEWKDLTSLACLRAPELSKAKKQWNLGTIFQAYQQMRGSLEKQLEGTGQ